MTVNVWAVSKAVPKVKIAGLCYGVTAFHHMLVNAVGLPFEEVNCQAIGVNHVALNLRFNQADIETTLKRLAEDVLPDFSGPDIR